MEPGSVEFGWTILARVEGDDSSFPPEERLTPEVLKAMAASYNPKNFRRAAVITGYDEATGTAGPAHWVGEFLPPAGLVEELSFDGRNLWGLLSERQDENGEGKITRAIVKLGMLDRSIAFWRHLDELKGSPPYLRHVAILAAEPAGIPGMPKLSEFVPDAERSGLEPFFASQMSGNQDAARIVAGAPFECRSLSEVQRRKPEPRPEEETSMTPDEIKAAMAAGLAEAVRSGPLADALNASTKASEDAVKAANDARAAGEKALADARALHEQSEARDLTRRVDALVTAGRMTRAAATELEADLKDLPADKRSARVEREEKRPASTFASLSRAFVAPEMPQDVTFPTRRFSLPVGAGRSGSPDPNLALAWGELRAQAGNDPKKFRELVYASAGEEVQ